MRIIFIYFIRKKKTKRVIAATGGTAIATAGIEIANAISTNPAIAVQTERVATAAAAAAADVGAANRYYFLYTSIYYIYIYRMSIRYFVP